MYLRQDLYCLPSPMIAKMDVLILASFLLSTFLVLNHGSVIAFICLLIASGLSYVVMSFMLTLVVCDVDDLTLQDLPKNQQHSIRKRSSNTRRDVLSIKITQFIQSVITKMNSIKGFIYGDKKHSISTKSAACGLSIEDELQTIAKMISINYVKSWCDILQIEEDVVMREGERILKHFFTNLSREFLSHLDVEAFLPEVINYCSMHVMQSCMEVPSEEYRDPTRIINELGDHEANIEEIVKHILIKCAPEDLTRILNSPLDQHANNVSFQEMNRSSIYLVIQDLLIQGFVLPLISIFSEPTFLNLSILRLCQTERKISMKKCDSKVLQSLEGRGHEIHNVSQKTSDVIPLKTSSSSPNLMVTSTSNTEVTQDLRTDNLKPLMECYPLVREYKE